MGKLKALPFVAAVAVLACMAAGSPASAGASRDHAGRALVVAATRGPVAAATTHVLRLAGSDRIGTAIAVSQQFPADAAGAVVLARSDAFPDGLAGGPLAVAKHAPLLLTPPAALDDRVAAEISRVLPPGGTVYELGGTGAISDAVDTAVKRLSGGYVTVRLSGADRSATSVAIAEALPTATRAFVVTGLDFPDALGAAAAAGAPAAIGGGVVLLSNGSTLPSSVKAYLDGRPHQVWGVGGPGAAAAAAYLTDRTLSVVGADRFETATMLAERTLSGAHLAVVVNGLNFPDGLSAGAMAGLAGAPVLLTKADSLDARTDAYLQRHTDLLIGGLVVGGTGVVSDSTLAQVSAAIG